MLSQIAASLERLALLAEAVMVYHDIAIPASAEEVRAAGRGIDISVVDEESEAAMELLREYGLLRTTPKEDIVLEEEATSDFLAVGDGSLLP